MRPFAYRPKTGVFQRYHHVICVSVSFLPPPQRENLEIGKAWGKDLHGTAPPFSAPNMRRYPNTEESRPAKRLVR
jgi:hypothetical protein